MIESMMMVLYRNQYRIHKNNNSSSSNNGMQYRLVSNQLETSVILINE